MMAAIKDMRTLFVHEMSDVYDAEHQLMQAMQEMMQQAENERVKSGLQRHIKETEQQVKNLDAAFKALGEKPEKVTCKGAAGLISEYKSTAKEIKAQELLDGFICGAGVKAEHYEIESYKGLVDKAKLMGQSEAAELFEKNLKMEEAFAEACEQLEKQLGQQVAKSKPELMGRAA
jgi:ferritin-like metal-binding protein YciE